MSMFRKAFPKMLIFAIPNGGHRNKILAQKLKSEGVVSGIPDLFIPDLKLWVEMKRSKGGSLSASQKLIIDHLLSVGYSVIVGKGCDDAWNKLVQFLKSDSE